ncbi:MAG: Gfo/Idh/MocA family protein [Fibrobacterota bacterium]
MKKLKVAIIGIGNMGGHHYEDLASNEGFEIKALCDKASSKTEFFKGERYTDSAELIRKADVDAVIISTPHYDHTPIAIDALDNGLHVLVEKPVAVHKKDAEKMNEAHARNPDRVFAAMFNRRVDPLYRKMRSIVKGGEVGEIRRVSWTVTDWFRTEAYYASGGWRATWKGEGGGVLLNQCPHNLDLLQWITGMPEGVTALAGLGKHHNIEVEDEVSALLEYPGGATGVFVTSTGEAPGTDSFEIAGDRGLLTARDGKLHFRRNTVPTPEFSSTTKAGFAKPEVWEVEIPVGKIEQLHLGVLLNFRAAILDGEKLIAPAEEGLKSVELANAMLLSGITGKKASLPLDGDIFAGKLNELIENSSFEKGEEVVLEGDFQQSYK